MIKSRARAPAEGREVYSLASLRKLSAKGCFLLVAKSIVSPGPHIGKNQHQLFPTGKANLI